MQFFANLVTSAAKLANGRPAPSDTRPSRPSSDVIRETAATSAPVFF